MKTMANVLVAWAALAVSALASAAPPVCTTNAGCVVVLDGMVSSGASGIAIAGAQVTIYHAQRASTRALAAGTSDASGKFSITLPADGDEGIRYAVARKGRTIELAAVIGTATPPAITINEMTMASYANSSVHVFPKGDPDAGFPAYADPQSTNPFHIVIDDDGFGWVTYTGSSTLSKFAFSKPGLVRRFTVPLGTNTRPKGMALDSSGNVWVAASEPSLVYAVDKKGKLIGGFSGGGILAPWGAGVDSEDNVWVANFGDMAGNVWITNNWKPSGVIDVGLNPGGDGIVIFVGLAAPVKPTFTGQPKAP